MNSDELLKFRIRTAEQNSKKGLDYEAKALLGEFNNHKFPEVWVDLFEDTYVINTVNHHETNKYIQSKNVKNFGISNLKTACESLFINFLSSEPQNLLLSKTSIDGVICLELCEINSHLNYEYVLFLKTLKSKVDIKYMKVNELFNFSDLSAGSITKLKKHLLLFLNKELENENVTKIKFEKLKGTYPKEDVMNKLIERFCDKLRVYICEKENYEYIPLELSNDIELKTEIFDEFTMRIRNKKDINPIDTTELLTKNEFFSKYSNKRFTKSEYDELLYKRLLGDITLNNHISLKFEYIDVIGVDFFKEMPKQLELIKEDLYSIVKLHPEIIDELFCLIYDTQNINQAEKILEKIIKYKQEKYLEISDISLKFLVYKMYETMEVYNGN